MNGRPAARIRPASASNSLPLEQRAEVGHRHQHALDLAGVLGRGDGARWCGPRSDCRRSRSPPRFRCSGLRGSRGSRRRTGGWTRDRGRRRRSGTAGTARSRLRTQQLAAPDRSGGSPRTLYSPAYGPPADPHSPVAPVSREAADASTPPMLKHWREVKAQHPQTHPVLPGRRLLRNVPRGRRARGPGARDHAHLARRRRPAGRGAGQGRGRVPPPAGRARATGWRSASRSRIPKLARGLVRREVVETVTPGAMLQEGWLAGGRNNFLVALAGAGGRIGLAALDLSTGEFLLETLEAAGVRRGAGTPRPGGDRGRPDDLELPADDGVLSHRARALGVRPRPRARRAGRGGSRWPRSTASASDRTMRPRSAPRAPCSAT